MKRFLPLWIILGVLLLLIGGAAGLLGTALVPLTVEAGDPLPTAAEFGRYSFLPPTGEVPGETSCPRTHHFTLRVLGIPRPATLTVTDTRPPKLTAIPQTCFLGDVLEIEDFVEVIDASATALSYVTPPDFDRPGEQVVVIAAVDDGGNRTEAEVPLTVHAIAHSVTAEAGTTAAALKALITDAIEGKVVFGDDMAAYDPIGLGEQFITITLDGEPVKLSVTLTDTLPPTGASRMVSLLQGQTAKADDFVQKITDETAVNVEFAAEPDYTPGVRSVKLRLTDAGGNTTELESVLRVYPTPARVTVELGTDEMEMMELLLGDTSLRYTDASAAVLTEPMPGEHTLTLVNTRGIEMTQTVTFADTTPPIGKTRDCTVYVGDSLAPADFVRAIWDATAVTVEYADSPPDLSRAGRQTVTLRLVDAAGNAATLTAALTVVADTEPPVLYGVSDKTVYIGESVSYRSGVSAWDNRDGAVTVKADAAKVNLRAEGKYPVTYTATDAAGNVASKTVTFTVRAVNMDAIYDIADGVLAQILRDGMTERERLWAIYDWSVKNLRYVAYPDKSDPVAAAYYGFRNGRGDCYVYYAVTRFLLTRAGIENLEICRDNPEKPHYWNLVRFEGNWYHLDTCPHYAAHPLTCFLLTDAEVKAYSENHVAEYYSFDASLYPPTP